MNSERLYELKQDIMSQDDEIDTIAFELLSLSILKDLSDDYDFCDFDDIVEIAEIIRNENNKDIEKITSAIEEKYEELANNYYDEIDEEYDVDI